MTVRSCSATHLMQLQFALFGLSWEGWQFFLFGRCILVLLTVRLCKDTHRVQLQLLEFLLAPKVLLDYLRPMITIPSIRPSNPQRLFNHLLDLSESTSNDQWPPMTSITSNDLQWPPMTSNDLFVAILGYFCLFLANSVYFRLFMSISGYFWLFLALSSIW